MRVFVIPSQINDRRSTPIAHAKQCSMVDRERFDKIQHRGISKPYDYSSHVLYRLEIW